MKFCRLDILYENFNSTVGLIKFIIYKKLLGGVNMLRLTLGVNGS